MDSIELKDRLRRRMGVGETPLWYGSSSRNAHVPSHVVGLVVASLFAYVACHRVAESLSDWTISTIDPLRIAISLIGAVVLIVVVLDTIRDMDVGWAITDRRIYRFSGRRCRVVDIRRAASLDVERADSGRGTLVVRMPENRDADGDPVYPSVRLLDVGDVAGAYDAVRRAQDAVQAVTVSA